MVNRMLGLPFVSFVMINNLCPLFPVWPIFDYPPTLAPSIISHHPRSSWVLVFPEWTLLMNISWSPYVSWMEIHAFFGRIGMAVIWLFNFAILSTILWGVFIDKFLYPLSIWRIKKYTWQRLLVEIHFNQDPSNIGSVILGDRSPMQVDKLPYRFYVFLMWLSDRYSIGRLVSITQMGERAIYAFIGSMLIAQFVRDSCWPATFQDDHADHAPAQARSGSGSKENKKSWFANSVTSRLPWVLHTEGNRSCRSYNPSCDPKNAQSESIV